VLGTGQLGAEGGRLVEIRVVAANWSQTSVALHAPHPPSVQKGLQIAVWNSPLRDQFIGLGSAG
jgi:hypothetical protein